MIIPYQKCSSQEEAREAIQGKLPELLKTFRAEINHKKSDPNHISVKGKGFEVSVEFQPNEAKLSLCLSFFLKAFQGKIEEKIRQRLERVL